MEYSMPLFVREIVSYSELERKENGKNSFRDTMFVPIIEYIAWKGTDRLCWNMQ